MENTTTPQFTVGVDVSDRYSHFAILDAAGQFVEEGRHPTTIAGFKKAYGGRERMRIAIEVGTHSPWISRLLSRLGHEVLVANARKLRMIYQSDTKTDKADARMLARLARTDPELLHPLQHRSELSQHRLEMIRAREVLVRARTRLVLHVRGVVKSTGARVPSCSTPTFPKVAVGHLPRELSKTLRPLLTMIHNLTKQITCYDREVVRLARNEYPCTGLLQQVTGVGPLTALTYVLVIDDPARFKRSRKVGAYLGLRARLDESGLMSRVLRITKTGDPLLRHLLVGSAHYILGPFGPDCDLKRWGLELVRHGGRHGKKKAAVAVARKLAVLLHRLWQSSRIYDPHRHSRLSREKAAPMPA